MEFFKARTPGGIFLFPLFGALGYLCASSNGPLGSLFESMEYLGWNSWLGMAFTVGGVIGLAMPCSVLLCFPEARERRICLLIAGGLGGGAFWMSFGLSMFLFVGLLIFSVAIGLCGTTLSMKVNIMLGLIIGNLLGKLLNGLP